MLHAKFRGSRPAGSREEDFWKVFTICGRGGHLGHDPHASEQTFVPPTKWGSTKNLALIGRAVSEKKMFEIVDVGRRTDAGPWVYYKLAMSLRLRWAKNVFSKKRDFYYHTFLQGFKNNWVWIKKMKLNNSCLELRKWSLTMLTIV